MDFQQAGARFKDLKAQFKAGTITESEFKSQLEELMMQDEQGNWWMIGYETERWYRHDGTNWVQSNPPGILAQESTPREGAETEVVEKAEQEIAERAVREKEEQEAKLKAALEEIDHKAAEKATREQAYQQPPTQSAPAVQPPKPKARNWMAYGAIILVVGIVLCSAAGIWIFNILNPPATAAPYEEPVFEPIAPYQGNYEAASGVGDSLTDRTLTLNSPTGGTLTFWTWYDIEQEYDYGFVEASTDGGSTWTPLPGSITVTSNNPNGSGAWANTLVGGQANTDTAITGSSDGWVEATFPLPADSGVLVRFNYYTDGSTNGQGWFIDDVRINGFSDNFEDGSGANWDLGGWIVTTETGEAVVLPEEAPTEGPAMPEVGFAVMPGGALEQAIQGAFAGTTVTVDGAFEGNDPDGVKFDESMQAFEDATGITVNYIGNKEFEASIFVRVDAGDAPDIVDFPQPGLFAYFVHNGNIVPVTDFISDEWLSQQYNPGWREFNTVDGVEAGVMHRYSGKSLVWYPKDDFDAAGYTVPETWGGLLDLTYRIVEDGGTPWCIGIESGAATGWVATDWTEDMMLRTNSLENYDAWVAGELPFDSDEVKNAISIWSEIWFDDALVYGGRSSIISTSFADAATPMFDDPPQCWMHRQANFMTSFFPQGAQYGVDYDFFYLPPVDESYGRPFLVAGDLIAMFNDRPEVRALMEYFTTPQSVSGWLEGGGAIAAQQTATQDMYGSDLDWNISQLVAQATSFRFDASDLMPGEVGAGSFWEHITSYVAGSEDLDTAMQEIDASWPR